MSKYIAIAREVVSSHRFVQLSAGWCPDCVYSNSIWKKYGVTDKIFNYDIAEVTNSRSEWNEIRDSFQKATGSRNLPTLYVDGKVWGTEAELHKFERNGTLKKELQKIGLLD
ncbi:unnamed protein product [Kluyveromyces dobzhanskii CBS 2104]|uniref:WGS project CCBQ000000000 data, contig 00041 n=1 Tax=Kluyveromyces dobzhanskii CBS 2104 TaxID=1427455 RepID=A0A0A8L0J9_9SACH|nr:unnamed protein product [Kluyveromyces dobzhanskii CBS 2104]